MDLEKGWTLEWTDMHSWLYMHICPDVVFCTAIDIDITIFEPLEGSFSLDII